MIKQYFSAASFKMAIYPLGESAIVLEYCAAHSIADSEILGCQRPLLALAKLARQHPQVLSAVPGHLNVTLRFDPLMSSASTITEWLIERWQQIITHTLQNSTGQPNTSTSTNNSNVKESDLGFTLNVRYGGEQGPDLQHVADYHGISCDDVIKCHSEADYHVLFNGFLPGFPYLTGLPKTLHTPRHASPRLSVNAGAVAIGGAQAGIYPCQSPGGWQIIGQLTDDQPALFNPNLEQPLLLPAGTRVRFTPA